MAAEEHVLELDSRCTNGITVELFFYRDRNEVWLHVEDRKDADVEFLVPVPNSEAGQAFAHPFLYAPKSTSTETTEAI